MNSKKPLAAGYSVCEALDSLDNLYERRKRLLKDILETKTKMSTKQDLTDTIKDIRCSFSKVEKTIRNVKRKIKASTN